MSVMMRHRKVCNFTLVFFLVFSSVLDIIRATYVPIPNNDIKYKLCTSKICEEAGNEIIKSLDQSIDPCDDFYKHACGGWIENHPVPESLYVMSQFDVVEMRLREQLKEILMKNERSDSETLRKIREYYHSCVDLAAIDARGLAPLQSIVTANGDWPLTLPLKNWRLADPGLTFQKIHENYGRIVGSSALFVIQVVPSSLRTGSHLLKLKRPISPSNRQRSFIRRRKKKNDFAFYTYSLAVATEFTKLRGFNVSVADIHDDIEQIYKFEFSLNELYTSVPKDDSDNGTFDQLTTIADLQKMWNKAVSGYREYEIDWLETIRYAFDGTDITIEEMQEISVPRENVIERLVNYVHWHAIDRLVSYTNKIMRDAVNGMTKNYYGYVFNDDERSTYCLDNHIMPEGLSYAWVREYFGSNVSRIIKDMVSQIQTEMKRQFDQSTWMDDDAKFRSKQKIVNMAKYIGYPSWYDDFRQIDEYYKKLAVGLDFFENVVNYNRFKTIKSLKKLWMFNDRYGDVDTFLSGNVNMYYQLDLNAIIYPAVHFQMPFFHAEQPLVLNYGHVGTGIGHEIAHGFGIEGIKYNDIGNKKEWWSALTMTRHAKKALCFIDQYSDYTLVEDDIYTGVKIDGIRTAEENIADNVGFSMALKAYLSYKREHNFEDIRIPVLQNYTDVKLFFYSLSNTYCASENPDAVEIIWKHSYYSPYGNRINGAVSNMREFSEAFNCPSGSPMNPVKKCVFWDDKLCESQICEDAGNEIIQSIDQSVDPCSTFYEHACGGWIANHPIPKGQLATSQIQVIEMKLQEQLKDILRKNETSDSETLRKVKDYYRSCEDLDAIDARGLTPLESIVFDNGGWPITLPTNKWRLNDQNLTFQIILRNYAKAVSSFALFDIEVVPYSLSTGRRILKLKPSMSAMNRQRLFIPQRQKKYTWTFVYDSYVLAVATEFARLRGFNVSATNIQDDLNQMHDFEFSLNELYSRVPSDSFDNGTLCRVTTIAKVHNTWNIAVAGRPEYMINWLEIIRSFFSGTGIVIDAAEQILVLRENFVKALAGLLKSYPLRTVVNYVHWHAIDHLISHTNKKMRTITNVLFRNGYGYVKDDDERSTFCIEHHIMPQGLFYIWLKKYMGKHILSSVLEMVSQVQEEMKRQFDRSTWMDDKTKFRFKDKIDNMIMFHGYPNYYDEPRIIDEFYSELSVGLDYFENVISYRRFRTITLLKKLRTPYDIFEARRDILPIEIIAHNDLELNSINFPVTMLQMPLFHTERSMVLNYGSMGATIGNEISHRLDIQGIIHEPAKDEMQSGLNPMYAKYNAKAKCFVEQYNQYTLFDDSNSEKIYMDGEKTLEQNIADNTGFAMPLRAYLSYKKKHNLESIVMPGLQSYTDEMLFFYSLSNRYCMSESTKSMELLPYDKTQSPAAVRINGVVSNMREFSEAFNCPSGSPMNPVKKCSLWDDQLCESQKCDEIGNEIVKNIEESVDPCNNFYNHACGGRIANYPLPEKQLASSKLKVAAMNLQEQLEEMLRKDEKSDSETLRKVKDYYRSCNDLVAIDARGSSPLESIVSANGGWPLTFPLNDWHLEKQNLTLEEIHKNYGKLAGSFALFDLMVVPNELEPGVNLLKLGLPMTSIIRQRSFIPQGEKGNIWNFPFNYALAVATEFARLRGFHASNANIYDDILKIYLFEHSLYKLYALTPRDNVDNCSLCRVMTIAEVQDTWNMAITGHPEYEFDWLETIRSAFDVTGITIHQAGKIKVPQENFVQKLAVLLKTHSLRTVVNYVHWYAIDGLVPYTNKKMRDMSYALFENRYGYVNNDDQRSTFCIDHHKMHLGLSYAYVRKYVSKNTSQSVIDMVSQIQVEMKQRFDQSTWMNDEAKLRLKEKLNNMMTFIGVPDYYDEPEKFDEFYSELTVGTDYFENVINYNRFRRIQMLKRLLVSHGRYEATLEFSPMEANAYDDTHLNIINFPVAMIQIPYFDDERLMALKYGSMGAAIGYEISRGLGIQGEMYGDVHNDKTLWLKPTIDRYNAKAKCFVDKYNNYTSSEDLKFRTIDIDHKTTLGQNIAVYIGFATGLRAYLTYKKKHSSEDIKIPVLQRYTDEMLFFYALIDRYCPSETSNVGESMGHTTAVTINVAVSNMRAFSKAFKCPSGSLMNPVKKCVF